MIRTDTHGGSLKEIKDRARKADEERLRQECEALAVQRFTKEQISKWSNQYKGLWYLPVKDEAGEKIEALAILKPIDRHILSYASTKIEDEGLYAFLEAAMRECWVDGDQTILTHDEFFIPAAMKFNKILESKKAALVKR
jgi:hypothetical protein